MYDAAFIYMNTNLPLIYLAPSLFIVQNYLGLSCVTPHSLSCVAPYSLSCVTSQLTLWPSWEGSNLHQFLYVWEGLLVT